MKNLVNLLICLACLTPGAALAQHPDIDLAELQSEVGSSNVNGTGVSFLHVEVESGTGQYGPNQTDGQNSTKTFDDPSGNNTGVNPHAELVGWLIYGDTRGVAGGLGESGSPPITLYGANDWIFNQLGANFQGDTNLDQTPIIQNYNVSNHSYIANPSANYTAADIENTVQRLDWVINQSEMSTVVGTNNGSANPVPGLYASAYNVMTVGRTDGGHAAGLTTLNGPGRLAVDMVAPPATIIDPDDQSTSYATAVVSGMAAVLHQTGDGITDATRAEVIKATLLAGATKEEFAGWDRTTTRPLDEVFGAGEANIYNSYHIQQGGEFNGSSSDPTLTIGDDGWDYEALLTEGDERFYEFIIGAGEQFDELSVILNWHADIEDTDAAADTFIPSLTVADLSLELYNSTGGFLGSLADQSDSLVDNVEHIYVQNLQAGTYHLRVANKATGSFDTDYGLAFRASRSLLAVPEPAFASVICLGGLLLIGRRRRLS
ncbi:MAG: hypothetical protein AAGA30_07135 [Planctomycetota bacterium]